MTAEAYAVTREVWQEFGPSSLLGLTELYCSLDVALLAEVFSAFRRTAVDIFELDPSLYISLPQYAYSSMKKVTRCELELISDPVQLDFAEKAIKGGFAFVAHRYFKKPDYLDSEGYATSAYLIDANNLYGKQSCRALPVCQYTWLNEEEISASALGSFTEP